MVPLIIKDIHSLFFKVKIEKVVYFLRINWLTEWLTVRTSKIQNNPLKVGWKFDGTTYTSGFFWLISRI